MIQSVTFLGSDFRACWSCLIASYRSTWWLPITAGPCAAAGARLGAWAWAGAGAAACVAGVAVWAGLAAGERAAARASRAQADLVAFIEESLRACTTDGRE